MNRILKKFHQLRQKGEKGLIVFLTAGDPDMSTTYDLVLECERADADIIEIGVPFSDPIADGPVIQLSSQRALGKGVCVGDVLSLAKKLRRKTSIPLVIMTYYNPVYRYGISRFFHTAKKSGIDGVIITDILPDCEKEAYLESKKNNVSLIYLVSPTTTDDRIKLISRLTTSFIYCVSRTGTTGEQRMLDPSLYKFLNRVRKLSDKFLAVGFGISKGWQAKEVAKIADAVVVGSAVVKLLKENKNKIKNFVKIMKSSLKG